MNRMPLFALLLILIAAPSSAQFAPTGTGGIEALDLSLRQLGHVKRVLLIGAHPDDEDSSLLSVMARGHGAQAAYLSLSRGEGGQNLIGTELGPDLGVLRSEELLAARARDGARQYFTRAFDFGYSKTLDETLGFWPRDTLIKDVVRVVRRFRPQIIVTTFSGTPRDGHGQHQSAGVAAREAFALAGDPTAFPELLEEEGLGPYTPIKLYQSARFRPNEATERLNAGLLDPIAGRSYFQIAMDSRSQHRSQDMGRVQTAGPQSVHLALLEDRSGVKGEAFAGIDTSFSELPTAASIHLEQYAALVDSARYALHPRSNGGVVVFLKEAIHHLRLGLDALGEDDPFTMVLREQERMASAALLTAAAVAVDATVGDPRLTPGQSTQLRLEVWNAGVGTIRVTSAGVRGAVERDAVLSGHDVEPGALLRDSVDITVRDDAPITSPYFTASGGPPFIYDWRAASASVRGMPFEPPPLRVQIALDVDGTAVELTREVVYRFGDQAIGEVRQPIQIVPAVSVSIDPEQLVWPLGDAAPRSLHVSVTNGRPDSATGVLRLELPEGWPAIQPVPFAFVTEDETVSVTFAVQQPEGLASGTYQMRAAATLDQAETHVTSTTAIRYPHVRTRFVAREATTHVHAVQLSLPRVSRVGYIRGASDVVPEALRAVGLPIELLDEDALANADLSVFDVIVVGSRAYETRPALREHNARLLEYGREGGTVIVQYQQYQFERGGYAPYPMRFARPHDRITDETAEPRLLDPTHPALSVPNTMTEADWRGWVQERGLYFANEWDDAYRPLVEFADPGEEPKQGGLLVARLGDGVYVYTGLSFFRELPAGVPGAYRLLVNLLGLRSGDVF